MVLRSVLVRRGRALTALAAIAVAAAVTTALLNLNADAQAKLRSEFRNYGANVVVVARESEALRGDALSRVDSALAGRVMAVPVAYAVARSEDGVSVVVAGTDLERARKMNPWWSVTALKSGQSSGTVAAIAGARALNALAARGQPFSLRFGGRSITVAPTAVLRTGAAEDSRIYIDLAEFVRWTGVQPTTIEVAVAGSTRDINRAIEDLRRALPEADVRPIRQIAEAEARVLGKTRSALLGSTAAVIATAALCVLATLLAWVFDRRRDFAVMRALGAPVKRLEALFAAEAALIGAVGAAVGFGVGTIAAAWIGRVNFQTPVVPRLGLLPPVLISGIVLALVAAMIPLRILRRFEPAVVLRGE